MKTPTLNKIIAMARGILVVDEHHAEQQNFLREKNIRVILPKAGTPDSEIAENLAPGRILVTKNVADFEQLAIEHEFGIISTQNVSATGKDLAAKISTAITKHKLWSLNEPFLFSLSSGELKILKE